MHRSSSSQRRALTAILAVLVLAGVGVALWQRGAPVEEVPVDATREALARLDDMAVAAEAQVALAALRSGVTGRTVNRAGGHARRMAEQLDLAVSGERRARSETLARLGDAIPDLRTQLQSGDPQAVSTLIELEEALRAPQP
jgi:hypothetical protein